MKRMINNIVVLFLVFCWSCSNPLESGSGDGKALMFEVNPRLPVDANGFYHLTISDDTWQTLHRLSGYVYHPDSSVYEVKRVLWQSSHYWYLGDTLGYAINAGFTDDLVMTYIDTSYITGFDGFEVPTVNCCSYSNGEGEVNTMFAPVQSMVGDTVAIRMYFFNEWNFEYDWEIFYIVLD